MTTETLTLSQFLLERIAEDEAVALAAIREPYIRPPRMDGLTMPDAGAPIVDDGRWSVGDHSMDEQMVTGIGITIYDEGGHSAEQARHIAHNDPARVLATCKAHRAIVELHSPSSMWCEWSQDSMSRHDDYLCDTLRALASVYADHPSFDPGWAL